VSRADKTTAATERDALRTALLQIIALADMNDRPATWRIGAMEQTAKTALDALDAGKVSP
jgi:hypothetical protein